MERRDSHLPSESSSPEAVKTDRFEIERRLGAGGMGQVFAAFDHQRGERVALKTLHHRDGVGVYRFKREFRNLADVAHPNLVALYELFGDDDQLFFTMELVDGVDFLSWIGGTARPHHDPDAALGDPARLRDALHQAAAGLQALHDAGKVHCDVKPPNVLVTASGRVVILDFGVARDLASAIDASSGGDGGLVGAIDYMAPEVVRGEGPTPASDWYSLGVMLFQALTGRRPFEGPLGEILAAKSTRDGPSPSELRSGLPSDLVELCVDLLRVDAARRPDGKKIQTRLAGGSALPEPIEGALDLDLERSDLALLGRRGALAELESAFEASQAGEAVAIYVHGESGMGKTAFLSTVLRRLADEQGATVLAGRCYKREMMPFKAVDGILDSLSRHLRTLSTHEVEVLLPRYLRDLTGLFPVLLRVEAVAQVAARGQGSADRATRRQRAFAALRELLERLAHRCALVLHIDDLHWADADSASLLEDLLRPPDPPPLLLIASFRREEISTKAFLAELLESTGTADRRELALGPLDDRAASELARKLLGADASDALVAEVVREAGGSPFFLQQLAGFVKSAAEPTERLAPSRLNLGEMLVARLERLPAGAAAFLEVLAVAGRPLDASLAHRAAGLEGDERPLAAALRAAFLLRSSGEGEQVEIYHSRLRAALRQRLDETAERAVHRRLAEALLERGVDDPEALYGHFLRAGDARQAAEQAVRVAERAAAALAFEQAARFYRDALDLGVEDLEIPARALLLRGLADALANAGRPGDAAEAYLEAAAISAPDEALHCRQLAARESLTGGDLEEGVRLLQSLAKKIGLDVPPGRLGLSLRRLASRFRLRWLGTEFTRREVGEIPRDDLLRLDLTWAMVVSQVSIDPGRGAVVQARHLLEALRLGEPTRVARAMSLQALFGALEGRRSEAERWRDAAHEVARQANDPYAMGNAVLHAGTTAQLLGRWREGEERCAAAERIFLERCRGVFWELALARRFRLVSLFYLGEIRELRRLVPSLLATALERGDVLTATQLRVRLNCVWLVEDDPDGARREIDVALADWSYQMGFHALNLYVLVARTLTDLYAGDPRSAWTRLEAQWPRVSREAIVRVPMLWVETQFLRGQAAVAAFADRKRSGDSEELASTLRAAEGAAGELERVKPLAFARPLAEILRGGLAAAQGEESRAVGHLRLAVALAEAQEMRLYAAAARRRRGEILGGEEGRAEIAQADAWMVQQRVLRPETMAAMLVPGLETESLRALSQSASSSH